jgi:hypothetical protein
MPMTHDRDNGQTAPIAPVASTGAGSADCCPLCDIPVFCRNHYYRGKLLTEREFADEQRYFMNKLRLHDVALHGWGVACGLHVKPHPYCPELRLVVEEGLAIDSCGRDIRVLKEVTIDLPQPPARPPHDHRDYPEDEDDHREGDRDAGYREQGHSGDSQEEGRREEAECEPKLPSKTLYLCLSYAECDSEFAPAPFDECGCNTGSSLRPNRICEGYRLELYDGKPSFWDEAVGDECDAEDCRVYFREGQEHCKEPGRFCCVPLAVIMDVVPGQKVTEEQIRTHGYRRRIASTETLDRVVRCILEKLPAETLTRIDDTNWEHDQRYLCREFMSEFVGNPGQRRGFRISFTGKVDARAIESRTFQALVVYRSDDPGRPRRMEIAPAEVHKDEDETDWCRLCIDPAYARDHLDMHEFDLFITLKCDVITDHRGLAVDGNFIARRFPTGDNVQGGTFESWIRVRPRHIPA